jgi:predicted kinase
VPVPTLVVVSGPPGSGKTRLAHALAAAIPCPAVCRDEIKEGMVHALGGEFEPAPGDPLTLRTLDLFFELLRILLSAEVTVVAEAAFQDARWRAGLGPLSELAQLRIVLCTVDADVAWERAVQRRAADEPGRAAHAAAAHLEDLATWRRWFASFEPVSIAAPAIAVDTTDGYLPDLSDVVEFVNAEEERSCA